MLQHSLPSLHTVCHSQTFGLRLHPSNHGQHHECQLTATPGKQHQWQALHRRRGSQPGCAEAAEQETAAPVDSAEPGPQRCKLCGVDLASAPRGCDNEGHVIKGLGSWPGFGWFEALRVYGHCPEAQKKGIAYTRKGDTLDEIMFGKK